MAINTGATPGNLLVRDEIWSKMIQEELEELLFGQTMVEWITGEFADGDMITIPTLASMQTRTYTENQPITIDDPSVGEFQLEIDKYNQVAIAVTDKMKQDTYYMEVLVSKFPQQVVRALMERLESDIMNLHRQQTTNDANTINGYSHRYDATGTSQAIQLADIAYAKLALDKANVSKNGRMAIVDPKVSYQLIQIDNVIRQDVYGANTNLKDGFGGTEYIGKYMGFDFYESNMLDTNTDLTYTTDDNNIANLFLGPEAFIGAMRQTPEIETSRDWERLRDVYSATMRYGLGLYRPEALVCVLSK